MNIDYSKITNNSEVVKLLKQRLKLEAKIKALDPMALINHEIELLSLPDVGKIKPELPQLQTQLGLKLVDGHLTYDVD